MSSEESGLFLRGREFRGERYLRVEDLLIYCLKFPDVRLSGFAKELERAMGDGWERE